MTACVSIARPRQQTGNSTATASVPALPWPRWGAFAEATAAVAVTVAATAPAATHA
jgi:hypothetical protein